MLEELWRIKDELAREAGHDVHRLCENTRRWAAAHPHPGPRACNSEELRELLVVMERQRADESASALKDAPPHAE
jgi:hypothetical protein